MRARTLWPAELAIPLLRRRAWVYLAVLWPFVVLVFRGQLYPVFGPWFRSWGLLVAMLLPVWLAVIVHQRMRKGTARAVVASNGCACVACGFDLSGLPPEGVCPECGSSYTHQELRERWRSVGYL